MQIVSYLFNSTQLRNVLKLFPHVHENQKNKTATITELKFTKLFYIKIILANRSKYGFSQKKNKINRQMYKC